MLIVVASLRCLYIRFSTTIYEHSRGLQVFIFSNPQITNVSCLHHMITMYLVTQNHPPVNHHTPTRAHTDIQTCKRTLFLSFHSVSVLFPHSLSRSLSHIPHVRTSESFDSCTQLPNRQTKIALCSRGPSNRIVTD